MKKEILKIKHDVRKGLLRLFFLNNKKKIIYRLSTTRDYHVEISTVSKCFHMCTYCPQETLIGAYSGEKVLKIENYKKMLSNFSKNIDLTVHFSGFVEPTMNPKIVDILLETKKYFKVWINTTLNFLRKKDFQKFIEIDFENINLHLPDNQGHMKCRINDDYIEILDRITSKKKLTTCNVFGEGIHNDLNSLTSKLDIGYISIKENDAVISTRANNVEDDSFKKQNTISGPIYCTHQRLQQNVVMPNGDMYLCCMDYGLKHKIGNLLESNYLDIVSIKNKNLSDIVNKMSSENDDIICRQCSWAGRL
jgi:radical SAM protein with 4Fe4S-binding SPASM domain